jgi:hypothetical protein
VIGIFQIGSSPILKVRVILVITCEQGSTPAITHASQIFEMAIFRHVSETTRADGARNPSQIITHEFTNTSCIAWVDSSNVGMP